MISTVADFEESVGSETYLLNRMLPVSSTAPNG